MSQRNIVLIALFLAALGASLLLFRREHDRRTATSQSESSTAESSADAGQAVELMQGEDERAVRTSPQRDSLRSSRGANAAAERKQNTIRGSVRDDAGSPVAAFQVIAEPAWLGLTTRLEVATKAEVQDASGRFTIGGLHDGVWHVHVETKDGESTGTARVTLTGEGVWIDLVLVRSAQLAGIVRDPAGRGIAGAAVTSRSSANPGKANPFGQGAEQSVTTDRDGRFALTRVPPGPITLIARAEGWAASDLLEIEVAPAVRRENLILTVRRGARLTCEVLDASGNPDARRTVTVFGPLTSLDVPTDSHGRFELEELAPGEYSLSTVSTYEELSSTEADPRLTYADRLSRSRRRAAVDLAEGATAHIVLGGAPSTSVRVHGTIRRARSPVSGAKLSVGRSRTASIAFSTDDGGYELVLNASGQVVFELTDGSGAFNSYVRAVPESGAVELDFDLPAGEIAGRVVGQDGRVLAKVYVSLFGDPAGAASPEAASSGAARTDDKGRFRFSSVRDGSYTLRVGEGFGAQRWPYAPIDQRIALGEGDRVAEVDVVLPLAGWIAGTVRGPDGKLSPGAEVCAFDALSMKATARVDASGSFSLESLHPGKVRVLARTDYGCSEWSDPVEVRAGETLKLDLAIAPATLLRAVAVDARGEPMDAWVSIFGADGCEVSWRVAIGNGLGRSESACARFPRGVYQVTAWDEHERSVSASVNLTGQDEENVRLVFDDR